MGTKYIQKICIILFYIISFNGIAQVKKQTAFTFNYNYQIPSGEMASTFNNNSSIGSTYFIETNKNLVFGAECNYLFAPTIIDPNIFENINTSDGAIIGADGYYTNVNVMQRGLEFYLFTGYAFHLIHDNLSGFYLNQGIGYLQHQIFIDTKNQNIPQLNEEMKKGYDRLTNGLSTKLSIDYKYYHKRGRFQFGAGVNYTVAYTKNQRLYNYAENKYYSQKRNLDRLLGFRIEIIFPIKRKNEEKFHYY